MTLLGDSPRVRRIDPKAYEMYLKAQFIVHTENRAQLRQAQALLDEVLEIEPAYVPALNTLGRLYYRIPKSEGLSAEQNQAEIRAVADRIVALDPEGISAVIWQGWFAYVQSNLQEAARYYEKAMSMDRNNVDLLRVVILFLAEIDRPDDAIALGRYLLLRDPACGMCIQNLARVYRVAGRHEEAARTLETILLWHAPTGLFYWSLGVSWLVAGFPDRALAAFETESLEGNREMGTTLALHDLGRTDEFEQRFATLRTAADDAGDAEMIARIYAWAGDNDRAFEWLHRMLALGGAEMVRWIDTDLYAKIKSDPRWRAMRDEYGYHDDPVAKIEFEYVLPPGASVD